MTRRGRRPALRRAVGGRPPARRPRRPLRRRDGSHHGRRRTLAATAALADAAARVAGALSALGVTAGDRVATMLDPSPAYLGGVVRECVGGAIEVPVNTDFKGEFLEHVVRESGASVLVGAVAVGGACGRPRPAGAASRAGGRRPGRLDRTARVDRRGALRRCRGSGDAAPAGRSRRGRPGVRDVHERHVRTVEGRHPLQPQRAVERLRLARRARARRRHGGLLDVPAVPRHRRGRPW